MKSPRRSIRLIQSLFSKASLTYRLLSVACCALTLPNNSLGDTVLLRSGEKVIGQVIADERTKLVIKSPVLGRLELPRDQIERVELDITPGVSTNQPAPGAVAAPAPTAVVVAKATVTNSPDTGPKLGLTQNRGGIWKPSPATNAGSADWIQLKSGEWLRGRLYGMQNRKLEFDSDELNDLTFDWKDVNQVVVPQALISYGDRQSAWGAVQVDREKVIVKGGEEVTFPRYELVGIAPGSPRELDYWSGRFDTGLNLRAGNTEQVDLFTKFKVERRTPITHLKLEYVGNYSELNGVESVNNIRATQFFDMFLNRRLFVRVPQVEFYQDPFQNIRRRVTLGGGMGYYLIDLPKTEWLVAGGPAYQTIRFDTVEAGQATEQSTPAFIFQSNFEIELTKRIDLELDYQAIVANEASGGVTHHSAATLEIDLTRRLELDLSFIWDRISNPQADSSGVAPQPDDLRLNLSLGIKF